MAGWLCVTAEVGAAVPAEHLEPARSLQVPSAVVGDARAARELCQWDRPQMMTSPNPLSLRVLCAGPVNSITLVLRCDVLCCYGICQCPNSAGHWGSRCSGTLVWLERCPCISHGMPWEMAVRQGMLLSCGLARAHTPSVGPARWPLPAAGCQAEQAVMAEHPARAGLLKGDPGPSGSGTHGWDRLHHSSSPRTM